MTTPNGERLLSYIERVERLDEEMKELRASKKEVFEEAKGCGFNPKVLRKIISLRKEDAAKREVEEHELAVYLTALGMA